MRTGGDDDSDDADDDNGILLGDAVRFTKEREAPPPDIFGGAAKRISFSKEEDSPLDSMGYDDSSDLSMEFGLNSGLAEEMGGIDANSYENDEFNSLSGKNVDINNISLDGQTIVNESETLSFGRKKPKNAEIPGEIELDIKGASKNDDELSKFLEFQLREEAEVNSNSIADEIEVKKNADVSQKEEPAEKRRQKEDAKDPTAKTAKASAAKASAAKAPVAKEPESPVEEDLWSKLRIKEELKPSEEAKETPQEDIWEKLRVPEKAKSEKMPLPVEEPKKKEIDFKEIKRESNKNQTEAERIIKRQTRKTQKTRKNTSKKSSSASLVYLKDIPNDPDAGAEDAKKTVASKNAKHDRINVYKKTSEEYNPQDYYDDNEADELNFLEFYCKDKGYKFYKKGSDLITFLSGNDKYFRKFKSARSDSFFINSALSKAVFEDAVGYINMNKITIAQKLFEQLCVTSSDVEISNKSLEMFKKMAKTSEKIDKLVSDMCDKEQKLLYLIYDY
jgi:hypothetical protein